MIYDCFTFFNELDLLEIRLNVLNDVVDKFVLVEATLTHAGQPKPLYYNENKERYAAFADKIIHIIIDDYPEKITAWSYENHQRNCILRGLTEAAPQDTILISDLDEIPAPEAIRANADTPGIKLLVQNLYNYYINCQNSFSPKWYLGTKMLSYDSFSQDDSIVKSVYSIYVRPENNQGVTPTKVRFCENTRHVKNGGWHFSYLGGVVAIIKKLEALAHQEYNMAKYKDPKQIEQIIQNGGSLFGHSDRFFGCPIDSSYPAYIRENQDRFAQYIFPITPEYLRKTAFARRYRAIQGILYHTMVACIPACMGPFCVKVRNLLWFGQTTAPNQ